MHRVPTHPFSPLVAAWGSTRTPIVVRCGVSTPTDYDPAAELTAVNIDNTGEVAWFSHTVGKTSTLTTVRRPVKVELTLPSRYRADVILGAVTKVVATKTPKGADGAS